VGRAETSVSGGEITSVKWDFAASRSASRLRSSFGGLALAPLETTEVVTLVVVVVVVVVVVPSGETSVRVAGVWLGALELVWAEAEAEAGWEMYEFISKMMEVRVVGERKTSWWSGIWRMSLVTRRS
jgi:hypothetical protein